MKLGGSRQSEEPELNLVPLIDVIFTLIIFFVLTTSFNQRSALKLQLPSTQQAARTEPGEPLTVMVDAEGKFFVGNMEVLKTDTATLKDAIAQVAGSRRDRPVLLRADARTPHQSVVTAMDALGQLGFVRISIATTPEARR
jgi:biopolymer transport protein ExbD